MTLEVGFEVLFEELLDSTSLQASPLEPDGGGLVVVVVETEEDGVEPVANAGDKSAVDFWEPVEVAIGCTADELAIRSESLSDKSELLEELSLMSQWPLDPAL